MTILILAALAFCGITTFLHLASVIVAIVRCRPRRPLAPAPDAPPVTIVRPVCGIDNFVEETLASTFALDYPAYEIIFCVAHPRDPIVPLARRLIAAHPLVPARLLVGDERVNGNPKLNNCVKGWNAAAHEWIVIADSNVLMPPDYLQRLLATWEPGTGLICAPPIGVRPANAWAALECAFLNTYQARWQYFSDATRNGFAQGKTMLWRRSDLEAAGGIRALGAELAEDAAATKVVRALGLEVHLVDAPFAQPLGRRDLSEVWGRQTRWARLRHASFPHLFYPEILSGALLPMLTVAVVAAAVGWPVAPSIGAFVALWYGAEVALAMTAGWDGPALYAIHGVVRDLLLPAIWLHGLLGTEFVWRGNAMSILQDDEPLLTDGH
ncbi:MAG TPA: ceramide glucosyltransferase [Xanthobacteraceae bacterium]|jgi:ceramide glucosyltransferase